MKQLNEDQATAKWSEIIKMACPELKPEYTGKVCLFAHLAATNEMFSPAVPPARPAMISDMTDIVNHPSMPIIPINLKIINKISDLSKVVFTHGPTYIREWYTTEPDSSGVNHMKYHTVNNPINTIENKILAEKPPRYGLDAYSNWCDHLERSIIDIVTTYFNRLIDEGNTLYIYMPVSDIMFIDRGDEFEIKIRSRLSEIKETTVSLDDI
jgi:hypothetical protein